jgi:hypothetical protein
MPISPGSSSAITHFLVAEKLADAAEIAIQQDPRS